MNPPSLMKPHSSKCHGWRVVPLSARRAGRGLLRLLKCCLPILFLAAALTASAQTVVTTTNFTVSRTVPDGSASGLASATNVSTPILYVTGLKVNLKISGAFNGVNPNGEWVLFVADIVSGDIHTLDNWGLEITGYTGPSIVSNPASVTTECSGNAAFSVAASGSSPLSYQWRHNGTAIPDAT